MTEYNLPKLASDSAGGLTGAERYEHIEGFASGFKKALEHSDLKCQPLLERIANLEKKYKTFEKMASRAQDYAEDLMIKHDAMLAKFQELQEAAYKLAEALEIIKQRRSYTVHETIAITEALENYNKLKMK